MCYLIHPFNWDCYQLLFQIRSTQTITFSFFNSTTCIALKQSAITLSVKIDHFFLCLSPPLEYDCLVPRGGGDWLPDSLNLELSLQKWSLSWHLKDTKNWGWEAGREVQDVLNGTTSAKALMWEIICWYWQAPLCGCSSCANFKRCANEGKNLGGPDGEKKDFCSKEFWFYL